MTLADAYNLVIRTIEERLAGTVKRWGYTVPKVGDGSRVYWLLKEIEPWEIISVTERKPYIRLWRPTNYVRRVHPKYWGGSPEELTKWVSSFVTIAIEKAVIALAEKALKDIEAMKKVSVYLDGRTLQLEFGAETFYLYFRLRKTVWNWKITSERRLSLANISQPIAEHPINTLLAVARNFGLLIL
jgi:hypothetical protein